MLQLRISDFPHLKQDERDKFYRHLKESSGIKEKALTPEQVRRHFKIGILDGGQSD